MNFRKRLISTLLILVLSVSVLSGCASHTDGESFLVVTSFYPLYVFTRNITEGAENVEVVNMASENTGCLHDYQLLPKDMKLLENADLFIVNGAGMEGFLDKVTESVEELEIVTATENVELIFDEHNNPNPHTWMYIPNAITEIECIKNALSIADPDNKDTYNKNFDNYKGEIK